MHIAGVGRGGSDVKTKFLKEAILNEAVARAQEGVKKISATSDENLANCGMNTL